MSAVLVDGVTKVFNAGRADEVIALSEVDLTVGDGEFVSLIGPSGCGKSTLLRLIADLIQPTAGSVSVAGSPAAAARRKQGYGIAFQQAGLFEPSCPAVCSSGWRLPGRWPCSRRCC